MGARTPSFSSTPRSEKRRSDASPGSGIVRDDRPPSLGAVGSEDRPPDGAPPPPRPRSDCRGGGGCGRTAPGGSSAATSSSGDPPSIVDRPGPPPELRVAGPDFALSLIRPSFRSPCPSVACCTVADVPPGIAPMMRIILGDVRRGCAPRCFPTSTPSFPFSPILSFVLSPRRRMYGRGRPPGTRPTARRVIICRRRRRRRARPRRSRQRARPRRESSSAAIRSRVGELAGDLELGPCLREHRPRALLRLR
jgi:hypothetical protein